MPFNKIISIIIVYLDRDENPPVESKTPKAKKDDNSLGNIEDSLIKLIRLLANICTDEKQIVSILQNSKDGVVKFSAKVLDAILRKNINENEEFLLNAISCLTNLLFYDTPTNSIYDEKQRFKMFQAIKGFLLDSQNQEI